MGTDVIPSTRQALACGDARCTGGASIGKQVLDITVLLGGPSSEREVSLVSGRAVADALRRRGHIVTESDISPQDATALDRPGMDVVFIALHGSFGEDGGVQRMCEQRGLRYVGCGPEASAAAMDKAASKSIFRAVGLTTADWVVIEPSMSARKRHKLRDQIAAPCVVKPVDGGSSVGVTIARDAATRDQAADALLAQGDCVMIETFVAGRELTIGILGDQALPIIEIRPSREFYDYYAKYQDDATVYLVDPPMPDATRQLLHDHALKAARALGCRDFCRVDFILSNDDGQGYLLEINTIPGFTSHSLLPKAAGAVGVGFDELCDRIARMAMER